MKQRAFTLIEVLAVVALIGLLAGATAWSIAAQAQRASRADAAGGIIHQDRVARLAAQVHAAPLSLRFDLKRQRIDRIWTPEQGGTGTSHAYDIPSDSKIDRILMPVIEDEDNVLVAPDRVAEIRSGVLQIPMSAAGRSVSYALRLAPRGRPGPEAEAAKWIVISGLTGQSTTTYDQHEVHSLFQTLAAGRPDPS